MAIFEAMTNKSPNQNMKIDPYTYPTFSNEPFSNPEALPDVYDHEAARCLSGVASSNSSGEGSKHLYMPHGQTFQ